jgi:uncharacterized peroxidase-related enzyme
VARILILDARSFELVTLAAALERGSSYCALAHSSFLEERYYSARELSDLLADGDASPLSGAQRAMMDMARKVARDPSSITGVDHQQLRNHGFSDDEIFDVVASAAARCFFAGVVDALGAQPDAAYAHMEPQLRDALTVGRPISQAQPERIND